MPSLSGQCICFEDQPLYMEGTSCQVFYSLMTIINWLEWLFTYQYSRAQEIWKRFSPASYSISLFIDSICCSFSTASKWQANCLLYHHVWVSGSSFGTYKVNVGSWIRKWLTRIWQKVASNISLLCALASKRRSYLYVRKVKISKAKVTCTGSLRCCAVSKRILCASSNNFSIWGSVQESMHFDFQNSSSTNSSR